MLYEKWPVLYTYIYICHIKHICIWITTTYVLLQNSLGNSGCCFRDMHIFVGPCVVRCFGRNLTTKRAYRPWGRSMFLVNSLFVQVSWQSFFICMGALSFMACLYDPIVLWDSRWMAPGPTAVHHNINTNKNTSAHMTEIIETIIIINTHTDTSSIHICV